MSGKIKSLLSKIIIIRSDCIYEVIKISEKCEQDFNNYNIYNILIIFLISLFNERNM